MNDYYFCAFHGILKRFICHRYSQRLMNWIRCSSVAYFLQNFVTAIHLVQFGRNKCHKIHVFDEKEQKFFGWVYKKGISKCTVSTLIVQWMGLSLWAAGTRLLKILKINSTILVSVAYFPLHKMTIQVHCDSFENPNSNEMKRNDEQRKSHKFCSQMLNVVRWYQWFYYWFFFSVKSIKIL